MNDLRRSSLTIAIYAIERKIQKCDKRRQLLEAELAERTRELDADVLRGNGAFGGDGSLGRHCLQRGIARVGRHSERPKSTKDQK